MTNQYLAFYASSHGFGHMTRCLAIIEELLETTNHRIYLARGAYQNSFARVYLAHFGADVPVGHAVAEAREVNAGEAVLVGAAREINQMIGRLQKFLDDRQATGHVAKAVG